MLHSRTLDAAFLPLANTFIFQRTESTSVSTSSVRNENRKTDGVLRLRTSFGTFTPELMFLESQRKGDIAHLLQDLAKLAMLMRSSLIDLPRNGCCGPVFGILACGKRSTDFSLSLSLSMIVVVHELTSSCRGTVSLVCRHLRGYQCDRHGSAGDLGSPSEEKKEAVSDWLDLGAHILAVAVCKILLLLFWVVCVDSSPQAFLKGHPVVSHKPQDFGRGAKNRSPTRSAKSAPPPSQRSLSLVSGHLLRSILMLINPLRANQPPTPSGSGQVRRQLVAVANTRMRS